MDYPPRKDVISVMHGQRPTKKLKNPHHTGIVTTKHYIEYRSVATKNGNNHHIYEPVNMKPKLDNFEPENIPVVINGCPGNNSSTIPIKKEVFPTKNILNDLNVELLEDI
jgi:hypothetical protein